MTRAQAISGPPLIPCRPVAARDRSSVLGFGVLIGVAQRGVVICRLSRQGVPVLGLLVLGADVLIALRDARSWCAI